jgi:hypothetical protein
MGKRKRMVSGMFFGMKKKNEKKKREEMVKKMCG